MYLRYNAFNNFKPNFDESVRDNIKGEEYSKVQEYITNTKKYRLNKNGVLL